MVSRKDRATRERYQKGLSKVYCMYCCEPFNMKDLFKKEGRYDVCKKRECIEAYRNDKLTQISRVKKESRKKQLEENYPDPTWMVGE